MESTHGTPPATGIASFRSTTTTNNIPLISCDVKQYFQLVVLIVYAFLCVIFLFCSFIVKFFFVYVLVSGFIWTFWHSVFLQLFYFITVGMECIPLSGRMKLKTLPCPFVRFIQRETPMIMIKFKKKHGFATTGTFGRGISEGR